MEEIYALLKRRGGGGCGASQEQIEAAVKKYMEENPIQAMLEYDKTKQTVRNKTDSLKYNYQTKVVNY